LLCPPAAHDGATAERRYFVIVSYCQPLPFIVGAALSPSPRSVANGSLRLRFATCVPYATCRIRLLLQI